MRKSHALTTCDKCSIRLLKSDLELHVAACQGVRTQWLSGADDVTAMSGRARDVTARSPKSSPRTKAEVAPGTTLVSSLPASSQALHASFFSDSAAMSASIAESTGLTREQHVGIEHYLTVSASLGRVTISGKGHDC